MIISSYVQQVALKRLGNEMYRPTIKDALTRLETVNKSLLQKQMKSTDTKVDNMLRLSNIEECNEILYSM